MTGVLVSSFGCSIAKTNTRERRDQFRLSKGFEWAPPNLARTKCQAHLLSPLRTPFLRTYAGSAGVGRSRHVVMPISWLHYPIIIH